MIDEHVVRFDPRKAPWPPAAIDPRRQLRRFGHLERAELERVLRAELLRGGPEELRAMGRRLRRCRRGRRCGLSICPVCARRVDAWAAGEVLRLFRGETELFYARLLPDPRPVAEGNRRTVSPERMIASFARPLEQLSARAPVVGGLSAVYDGAEQTWEFAFNLLAVGDAVAMLSAADWPAPPDGFDWPPILAESVPDHERLAYAAYCVHGAWPECERFSRLATLRGGRPKTAARLPADCAVDWMAWRGMYSPMEFLFLGGARLSGYRLLRSG